MGPQNVRSNRWIKSVVFGLAWAAPETFVSAFNTPSSAPHRSLLVQSAPPTIAVRRPCASINDLKGRCAAELDALFAAGQCVPIPSGFERGQVLLLSDYYRFPRATICLSNTVWKGKHFSDDGHFINQFVGFRALGSFVATEASWYDGLPCVVLQYPPGTPFFANMRDEVRCVGPNVFLSRVCERRCGEFRGYITIQPACLSRGR
jgi:hypothetical protein